MSAVAHRQLLACRDHVSAALGAEMAKRRAAGDAWIDNERRAVVDAANAWVASHGVGCAVTVADVAAVEGRAVGHIDYQSKLCLYVAEIVTGLAPKPT